MKLRSLLVKPWTIRIYIGCILLISIFGAHHLYSQIQLLKKNVHEIVMAKRNLVASAQQTISLLKINAANPILTRIDNDAPSPTRWMIEAKIQHGLDVILASAIKLKALNDRLPSEQTRKAAQLLSDISLVGHETLRARGEARTAKVIEFLKKMNAATAPLGDYIIHFTRLQFTTNQNQNQLLEETTTQAAILLGVFVFFASVSGILLRLEVATQKREREAEAQATFLAYHDPLTQLPNRIQFGKQAADMCSQPRSCMLFLLDLDEFQSINNSFGHEIGDLLLAETARRIMTFFDERDGLVARLSGDEFAAVIQGNRLEASLDDLCEDLRRYVSSPIQLECLKLAIRTSIGLALKNEGEYATLNELLSKAGLALREAKECGRDRYVIYHQGLAERARYRRQIKEALPAALDEGELEIHYQPQIHLASGLLSGFEALVRWRRNGALMLPGSFIPILEEAGTIRLLDLWVLKNATKTAAGWSKRLRRPISISVNLSSLNFQFDDIIGQVSDALSEAQLPPHLLTLEITETVLLQNAKRVSQILTDLSDLGVKVSLDDFGTGYSSLAYLRDLRFDELKIDRSFLSNIEDSHENMILLNSLVDIARGLGMNIVAEGIETLAQRDVLRKMGVQLGQGYLFETPVKEAEVTAIINREANAPADWNQNAEANAGRSDFQVA